MNYRQPNVSAVPDNFVGSVNNIVIVTQGLIGYPGLAMGPLGMTYTQPVVDTYTLQYKTTEGSIVGTLLKPYG